MNDRKKILLVPVVLLLLAVSVIAGSPRSKVTPQDVAKADYMFLEAQSHANALDFAGYLELVSRAHELNPSDTTVGFYSGLLNMVFTVEDSADAERQYRLMLDYVMNNPDDYSSARIFANLARNMDKADDITRMWSLLHRHFPSRPEITLAYAQALTESDGDAGIDHAVALLDSLEVTQGRSLGLSSNKMRLLMAKSDTAAMVAEIKRMLDFSPRSVETNIFAGDVYKVIDMPDTALYYYDRACEIDSTSGEAFYSRAAFYRESGDSARYDSEVFAALGKSSLDVDVKMEILKSYVSEQYKDSLQVGRIQGLFDKLITMHPHQPELHALYSRYLATQRNFREAAMQEEYAVDLNPDHLDEWKMLIILWRAAEDIPKAIESSKRALRYFPDDKSLKVDLGIYYTQTDTASAKKCFREVLAAMEPGDEELEGIVYTSLGDMYTTAGMVDSAIVSYETSIRIYPDSPMTLNNLAYIMADNDRDIDRARQLVEQSLKMQPDNSSAMDTYAWVLFKQKEYKEAKVQIDKAIEASDEVSEELLSHAGDIYFMNGLPDEAVELWKQALELNPDDELLKRKVKHKTYFYK